MSPVILSKDSLYSLFIYVLLAQLLNANAASAVRLPHCKWNHLGPLAAQPPPRCPPIVDERSPLSAFQSTPWSGPARCLRPRGGPGVPFCTLTAPSFRDDLAFSIITTPEVAANMAGSEAIQPTYSPWNLKELLIVPGPVADAQGVPSYEIVDMGAKGKGTVARRLIRKDEVLMLDFPGLMISGDFSKAVPNGAMKTQFVRRAVEQLPEKARKSLLALATSTGGDGVSDMIKTNACNAHLDKDEPYMSVFPEVSVCRAAIDSCDGTGILTGHVQRMNHACKPK